MCAICGCGTAHHRHHDDTSLGHEHGHGPPSGSGTAPTHEHGQDPRSGNHAHEHEGAHGVLHDRGLGGRMQRIEQDLLARNDHLAAHNREWLAAREIAALNLIGAPGAGKTSLLEATARRLAGRIAISVLEGDQETDADARRIREAGCRALQINTGTGCHLDAAMIEGALPRLDPAPGSLLFIENVGNLVCPALFDLGERAKVVALSVTEGDDKPLKYPHVIRAAGVLVVHKIDLLPYVSFDVGACVANALRVNPDLRVFRVSSRTGEGMDGWCEWLQGVAGERHDAREAVR